MELTSRSARGRGGGIYLDGLGRESEAVQDWAMFPLARRKCLSRTWTGGLRGPLRSPGGGEFGRADGRIGAWLTVGDRSGATWCVGAIGFVFGEEMIFIYRPVAGSHVASLEGMTLVGTGMKPSESHELRD